MTSLDLIVSFVAAARHGSFARAARELGVSPSAVAKNVARLESQLGLRLFHRTTRQVSLSCDGDDLFERCRSIVDGVESLEAAASESRSGVRGTLRIDLPVVYGRQVVLPVLMELMAHHPELRVDAHFSDQVVDVVKEGLDAAVRIGPLADSGMVARQFDQQRLGTYASPDYLQRRGEPGSPAELHQHRCVLFRMPGTGRERPWQFRAGRRKISFVPDGILRLGDGEALIQAAMAGRGLVQTPTYMADEQVERGTLVAVLERYRPDPLPVSLVYPSHRHVPARVRALADALARPRELRPG